MWRCGQAAQDGVERIARHLRLDPAQHVVGAKLDDDGVGALRHRPIEPGEPIGGGIAGDAGICDLGGNAFGGERRLQAGHKAVLVGQAVAGRQQIAERDDFDRRLARSPAARLSRRRAPRYKPPHRRFGPERAATHMIGHDAMKGAGQPAT